MKGFVFHRIYTVCGFCDAHYFLHLGNRQNLRKGKSFLQTSLRGDLYVHVSSLSKQSVIIMIRL